jgi:hypothetical protein
MNAKAIGVRLDDEGRRVVVYRNLDRKPRVELCKRRIVFDLNHVLCIKWFDPEHKLVEGIHVHGRHGNLAFTIRPGVKKLMAVVLKLFGRENVWIWTTAQRDTARTIMAYICPHLPESNILCADHCEGERRDIKNLDRIPGDHPILAFDDDPDKFLPHHQSLVRRVPPFEPTDPFDPSSLTDQGVRWIQAELGIT